MSADVLEKVRSFLADTASRVTHLRMQKGVDTDARIVETLMSARDIL